MYSTLDLQVQIFWKHSYRIAKNAFFTDKSGKCWYGIETASFGFVYKRPTQNTLFGHCICNSDSEITNHYSEHLARRSFSVGHFGLSQCTYTIHIKMETKTYASENKIRNECLIFGYDKTSIAYKKNTNAQIQYIVWPRNMHSIICITLKSWHFKRTFPLATFLSLFCSHKRVNEK